MLRRPGRTAVQAQTYPSRPIVMVVPYAAGGTFDVMGRIIAARMSELLGQQIVVENTTGAGGIIGVNRVVNAAPDGYTILLGSTGTHAYNQTIYKKRRYDAVNDFTPVTLFSEQPMVLEARKDLARQHHSGVRRAPEEQRRARCSSARPAPARPRIWPARCSTRRSASPSRTCPIAARRRRRTT